MRPIKAGDRVKLKYYGSKGVVEQAQRNGFFIIMIDGADHSTHGVPREAFVRLAPRRKPGSLLITEAELLEAWDRFIFPPSTSENSSFPKFLEALRERAQ